MVKDVPGLVPGMPKFHFILMNGTLEEFDRRPEDLDSDIARIESVLDRVYAALGNKEMPTQHKRFLLSFASDLEDDRSRLQSVFACLEAD